MAFEDPIEFLRSHYETAESNDEIKDILDSRDVVLDRYGSMFNPSNLDQLTADGFKSFLRFENNRHWKGIHRQQASITEDMDRLKSTLRLALDESKPIEDRLDKIIGDTPEHAIRGLGPAVLTPILHVVYPDRYGVWNRIAEEAMTSLGIWPSFDRGSSFGTRYRLVNERMKEIADAVGIDLWTLDAMWWAVESEPSYWLFQANPSVWDLEAELAEVKARYQAEPDSDADVEGDWSVTRFGYQMKPGDLVALWSSGPRAGVYGFGEISSGLFERPSEGFTASSDEGVGTETAIRFTYGVILDEPLLKVDMLDHPVLQNLSVIRGPQGSNFKVTRDQWEALWDLSGLGVGTFWVNQGQTYRAERAGGYLWAPVESKDGRVLAHHELMRDLREGDTVVSYASGAIRSLGRVTTEAAETDRPSELPTDQWGTNGHLARVEYFDLDQVIQLSEIPSGLRTPEAGPFTRAGGVKQGYLFDLLSPNDRLLREEFADRWPPGSPWYDEDAYSLRALHLLFKWSTEREPRTADLHREVSETKGSVWWGKFGTRSRAALSQANISRFRHQLSGGVTTKVYLYRPGDVWETDLLEITDDPEEVDDERLPSYYSKDEAELFVRISNFTRVDPSFPVDALVLASDPDSSKMPGALGNQRTPLIVRAVASGQPKKETKSVSKYDLAWLAAETLWPEERLISVLNAVKEKGQIVLAGPPGTGKTWVAERLATHLTQGEPLRTRTVQFHPSYGYEEFIEGLRPEVDDTDRLTFKVKEGVIREIAQQIDPSSGHLHVLVIDEMNRANLPRVFGELMYLFEYRDKPIDLQYTSDFELPRNLLFIGTMNTADRSIRSIDIALRRRFDVFECAPDPSVLNRYYSSGNVNEVPDLTDGFEALNAALEGELDRHHTIGQTFFMNERMTHARLHNTWERQLRPLIDEYFFDREDIAAEYTLDRFWPSSS